jgi:ribosome-associated protein
MSAEHQLLTLHGEYITLAQALKVVGLAQTGGQAKILVREGGFLVNGEVATQPGRKLRAGDRFGPAGGPEWTITA